VSVARKAGGRISPRAKRAWRLSARLDQELDAARAQREQAERHATDLDATDSDVSDAALAALGGVHDAIAAFIADARHLDEVRLRLRQVYESFTVQDDGQAIALIPTIRSDARDAVMADISAVRREALRATTHAIGLLIE
jgi:hypothetical protein